MHFPDASRRYDFDLARTRMLDTWWPKGRRDESVTQSLRCYGPAELKVLLEGTRLRVIDLLPGGALDDATGAYRPLVPLREAMSYRVTLRRQRSSAF